MNVRRFFAPSTREALRALKEELGADAIVLSNRSVAGGVEILALPPEAIGALHTSRAAPSRHVEAPDEAGAGAGASDYDEDFHVTLSSLAAGAIPRRLAAHAPRREAPPPRPAIRPFTPPRIETPDSGAATDRVAGKVAEKVAEKVARHGGGSDEHVRLLRETNARLMEELSGIRGVIEREFNGLSWYEMRAGAPARAEMLGRLLASGFSAGLARQLVGTVSREATGDEAREILRAALDRRLKTGSGAHEIIDEHGVYALVGPTGVGKTTTVAKLAARFVTRHGAGRLALVTTDGYRIGAQEQLRIYGRILGVPVFSVQDAAELRQTLRDLRDRRMVLIDTMGMGQRDRAVVSQATMLSDAGEVHRLLLLNATCRGDTLDDVVKAFDAPNMDGCIFTKVDEALSLAPALDVAMRRELGVHYIANGQRVPEDLHLPNRAWLVQSALKAQAEESPWRLDDDETGAVLRAQGA